MKIENTVLKVSRVEVVKRAYNEKGQIIHEEFQYFYPEEATPPIGFKGKDKK